MTVKEYENKVNILTLTTLLKLCLCEADILILLNMKDK